MVTLGLYGPVCHMKLWTIRAVRSTAAPCIPPSGHDVLSAELCLVFIRDCHMCTCISWLFAQFGSTFYCLPPAIRCPYSPHRAVLVLTLCQAYRGAESTSLGKNLPTACPTGLRSWHLETTFLRYVLIQVHVCMYICTCMLSHGPITVMNGSKNRVMPGNVLLTLQLTVLPLSGNRIPFLLFPFSLYTLLFFLSSDGCSSLHCPTIQSLRHETRASQTALCQVAYTCNVVALTLCNGAVNLC